MHSKEIETIVLSLDTVRWFVGGIFLFLFSTLGFIVRYVIAQISSMRAQIVSAAKECGEKSAKHIDDIDDRIEELNACREENTRHIVAIEHDLQAMIQICKERHNK